MNRSHKYFTMLTAVVLVMAVYAPQAHALGQNWSADNDTFLTLQGGTIALPTNDLVEIGVVTNVAAIVAAQSNPVVAQSFFDIFAIAHIGDGTGLEGSFAAASFASGAGFFSKQIYLLAFNATAPNTATQLGLFTNPGWTFAASDSSPPNNLDISDLGTTPVIGSYHAGQLE